MTDEIEKIFCECSNCEGKGEYEDDSAECECEGCCSGTHYFEAECGQETECPCEKCNETGHIKKVVKCEDCKGTGFCHTFQKVIGKQSTFDNKLIEIRKCSKCETEDIKIEENKKGG